MRYYVYDYRGDVSTIPGVIKNEEGKYCIDISDDEFLIRIRELSQKYDLMFLGPSKNSPHSMICFDAKNYMFKVR